MTARWLAQRLAGMVLVLVGVSIIVFFLLRLVPGDPAVTVLGTRATPQAIAELHREWGLDKSVPEQYGNFMGRLVRGDFGDSLVYNQPVSESVSTRIGPSIWLLVMGSLFAMLISVPLALLAATRKDSKIDHLIRVVPLVGFAMPAVWLGVMFILIFSLTLGLFPVGGVEPGFVGHLHSLTLPSFALALLVAPILIRSLRASLLDTLDSDYVLLARAKGLPPGKVLTRHALRNAAIPAVTVFGLNIIVLVSNLVVIEQVYAIPGLGALLVSASLGRDFPVVQAVTLFLALIVVVVFFLTDVVLARLDPRIKL